MRNYKAVIDNCFCGDTKIAIIFCRNNAQIAGQENANLPYTALDDFIEVKLFNKFLNFIQQRLIVGRFQHIGLITVKVVNYFNKSKLFVDLNSLVINELL